MFVLFLMLPIVIGKQCCRLNSYAMCTEKILIVSVDNRPAGYNYHTLSAIYMHHYAKHHGYDFLRVVPIKTSQLHTLTEHAQNKMDISIYDAHDNIFRSAAWAKIPVLNHLISLYNETYEFIFYVDSDVIINPTLFNHSVCDALLRWEIGTGHSMFIFSSFPWYESKPCTGSFMLHLGYFKTCKRILKTWWKLPSTTDLVHDYEQNVFITYYESIFKQMGVTFINEERQFRNNSSWIQHIGHGDTVNRILPFELAVKSFGIDISQSINNQSYNTMSMYMDAIVGELWI
jgi:hypothetical protein